MTRRFRRRVAVPAAARRCARNGALTSCALEVPVASHPKLARLLCALVPLIAALGGAATAGTAPSADVLIQAGHEGRPDCNVEPASLCNNTGAGAPPGEITWTPVVADEATRILRAAGVSVLREKAYLHGTNDVRAAVFLHFDGSVPPCSTKASVGYGKDAASKRLADSWKTLYGTYWPYSFEPDNFTSNLSEYYGFKHVRASVGAFVIEWGDMSCPVQHAWLAKRLKWQGALLAHFLSAQIGKGNVPLPPVPAR
jgi:hypothetical protein